MKELGALPRFQQNAVRPQEGPTCRIQFLPPKTWIDIPWPPPIFSAFPWGDLHGCCPPSHRPQRRLELEIHGGNWGDPPELAIDGYNKHLISKWETTWNTKVSQKKNSYEWSIYHIYPLPFWFVVQRNILLTPHHWVWMANLFWIAQHVEKPCPNSGGAREKLGNRPWWGKCLETLTEKLRYLRL